MIPVEFCQTFMCFSCLGCVKITVHPLNSLVEDLVIFDHFLLSYVWIMVAEVLKKLTQVHQKCSHSTTDKKYGNDSFSLV